MSRNVHRSHDELVRRGQDALDAEEFQEAEAFARRAMMRDTSSVEARQVLSSSLIEMARYEEALETLDEMLQLDPDDPVTHADAGVCFFMLCEFDKADAALQRALELDPEDLQAQYWHGLSLERRGEYERADEMFMHAHRGDPDGFPRPTRMSRREFQRVVDLAIEEIDTDIREEMKNLTIIIDDLPLDDDLTDYEPPLDPCLYGLYVGVPLPERSNADVPRLPDTIYIYQRNLERVCSELDTLRKEIRITLLHEVGHYLGYDEDDLAERGLA